MLSTRRDFLRAALETSTCMSLGLAAPDFFLRAAAAGQRNDRDTILVVIQLTGGNDGLNTVVPYADDEYGRNRTTLRLPTDKLHKIGSTLSFHPRMEAFLRLYREGYLSIVQGAGSPISDQNHERALRMWHTANPQRPQQQTGWLGRVVDRAWTPTKSEAIAVFIGPIARPFALNAENAVVPALRSAEDAIIRQNAGGLVGTAHPTDNALLRFLRESTRDARAKSERIEAALKAPAGAYPAFGLARDLRTVAQLIRAEVGIRIFLVELGGGGLGGFDNHANQLDNHAALLNQLAESVAAFLYDLKRDRQLDRVLLMTFSEFGRTVKENGRRGTDHGAAAPMFLAGGKVKGGLVGSHPSLTDLDKGALKVHTDFRRVYATVLDRWLGFESEPVLGKRFEPVEVLNA